MILNNTPCVLVITHKDDDFQYNKRCGTDEALNPFSRLSSREIRLWNQSTGRRSPNGPKKAPHPIATLRTLLRALLHFGSSPAPPAQQSCDLCTNSMSVALNCSSRLPEPNDPRPFPSSFSFGASFRVCRRRYERARRAKRSSWSTWNLRMRLGGRCSEVIRSGQRHCRVGGAVFREAQPCRLLALHSCSLGTACGLIETRRVCWE
jgi:hypothetical protein